MGILVKHKWWNIKWNIRISNITSYILNSECVWASDYSLCKELVNKNISGKYVEWYFRL